MFPPSIFEDRCVDFRRMIDVSTFEDRCVALRRSMSRCVDLRNRCIDVTMCRPSEIDVSTFEDRCVDLRRWMCWPSKIDDRCVDLRRSVIDVSTFEAVNALIVDVSTFAKYNYDCGPDVKLGCYTCSKYWYYSCMRITPRVCTSVLSLFWISSHDT